MGYPWDLPILAFSHRGLNTQEDARFRWFFFDAARRIAPSISVVMNL
jgi:hypothetical protein